MTETVWLSVAPQKSQITAWFEMEDRVVPGLQRSNNAMFHGGGGHLDPNLLPQRAVEDVGRKVTRLPHLFKLNGFLCVTEKAAAVLRAHDLGGGGLYPLELVRRDGVTPVPGQFWALNFGAKKNALSIEESRNIHGHPQHGFSPELWAKDDDIAVTPNALEGADIWGDELVDTGFFVSPKLGAALHKAGLAKAFHLMRCRIV
ncbi:imm11 family protein [Defluviimonas salinarum]|uniref:Immunity MXAN-0049 protein domain-containing protein n=1 Tax=Defluviimonas salinarum TaxID=2992147 RepID=A0ABT3J2D3_9RHOB|nr:hypothetical protein [Defluviimonas salinarum]MCW3781844.1 hypothetical protein [Defluviimonas salinarum]